MDFFREILNFSIVDVLDIILVATLLYYAYKYEYAEIAQYLGLASMRPLADYKATGKLSLDLNLLEVDISLFEDNSLLHIDNEFQLHFKYEEVPKEKIH